LYGERRLLKITIGRKEGRKEGSAFWKLTIALFLLSFTVRLFYNFWTGPVVTLTYPDEIRYLNIASSLAEQGQILVRGLPTTFQKILYPLILSPAFLITNDQITQMNIIRVINCLIISSTLFPVMLLARKITSKKAVVIISLFITATLPDMAYSATLMSETLNMPLVLWLFYFALLAIREQKQFTKLLLFSILGLITYLVYLNKEIGAAFLIAAILLLVIDAIHKRQRIKQNALSLFILAAAFFVPFFAMKLTLFSGIGNTYAVETHNQITLSAISSVSVFSYLIYSCAVIFIATILSFYVAPIFFALYGYSAMKEENKKIFLFTVYSLVLMIGAISYTISIRENLGDPVPNTHLRYIAPLVIPLMILCLDFLFTNDIPKPNKLFSNILNIIMVIFIITSIVIFPRGYEGNPIFDQFTLKITQLAESMIVNIGPVPTNIPFMMFKLFLFVLTVYGAFLIVKQKKKTIVIVILLCTVFIINIYDNFICYTSIRPAKTYAFSPTFFDPSAAHMDIAFCEEGMRNSYDIVEALISINNYINELEGSVIVFVTSDISLYTDTYLDSKAFPVSPVELYNLAINNGGSLRMEEHPISEGNFYSNPVLGLDTWKSSIFTADYIITLADDHPFVIVVEHPFLNVEVEYVKDPFIILRNLKPDIIYVKAY